MPGAPEDPNDDRSGEGAVAHLKAWLAESAPAHPDADDDWHRRRERERAQIELICEEGQHPHAGDGRESDHPRPDDRVDRADGTTETHPAPLHAAIFLLRADARGFPPLNAVGG